MGCSRVISTYQYSSKTIFMYFFQNITAEKFYVVDVGMATEILSLQSHLSHFATRVLTVNYDLQEAVHIAMHVSTFFPPSLPGSEFGFPSSSSPDPDPPTPPNTSAVGADLLWNNISMWLTNGILP